LGVTGGKLEHATATSDDRNRIDYRRRAEGFEGETIAALAGLLFGHRALDRLDEL
jgi:hypothetical protein